MTIHIDSLNISCIIGLLDFERELEQRVIIDLKADYTYADNEFVDYAKMAGIIENHLQKCKHELLENALLGLKEVILGNFISINRLEIKISKPDILGNCSVALSESWTNTPL